MVLGSAIGKIEVFSQPKKNRARADLAVTIAKIEIFAPRAGRVQCKQSRPVQAGVIGKSQIGTQGGSEGVAVQGAVPGRVFPVMWPGRPRAVRSKRILRER